MPTDEFLPLLDREGAVNRASPLIEAACPLLRELVNHASKAFRRCTAASDHLGGENEDLAPLILYRHTIELVDGIEALFRASCVDAAVPVLRAALEAAWSIECILQGPYAQRSLSWTCAYLYARINSYETLDPTTHRGKEFELARARESFTDIPPWAPFTSAAPVAGLQRVLA